MNEPSPAMLMVADHFFPSIVLSYFGNKETLILNPVVLAESKDQAQFVSLAPEDVEEEPSSGDKLAHRALLSAIVGLAACPPLLHFYSFWLLLQLGFSPREDVSRSGMAQGLLALIIDTAVIGSGFYLLGAFYSSFPLFIPRPRDQLLQWHGVILRVVVCLAQSSKDAKESLLAYLREIR